MVLDIGPGLQIVLLALLAAIPGTLAAYYGYASKVAIDKANSHLAIALSQQSNAAGESKLTITPLAGGPAKEA